MESQFVTVAVLCLVGLIAYPSYAGVTINGTSITFNDATVQSTAKPPDHGGTSNTVNGTDSFIGGGNGNRVTDDYGTIGGGQINQAGDYAGTASDAVRAAVGGGYHNTASNDVSTVGGGGFNTASGVGSTVSGGGFNTAGGYYATIGGGDNSAANGSESTVGGGDRNTASGSASTVGGGAVNTASGDYATVSGGYWNTASGSYSFVAGRNANDSGYANSFVWGGATGARTSAAANTFNVWSAGIYLNGALHFSSDRDMKEAYSFVSARAVLDKVVEMSVKSWRFKSEEDSIRHIGPVAQDFMAAFGYGVDDKHITATDADGVALAAIQGLHEMLQEKEVTLSEQDATLHEQGQAIVALRWQNAMLHARLARLEKAVLKEQD